MIKPWETHLTESQLKEIRDCQKLAEDRGDNDSYIAIIAKLAKLLDMGVVSYIPEKVESLKPIMPNKPKSGA